MPTPLVDIQYGRFFAQVLGDGIGVNLIEAPQFQAGVGVAAMLGYRRSDVPDGIGKLSSTLGGRAFVSGHLGGVAGTVALVHAALGGDFEGFVLNSRVSYPVWLGRLMLIRSVWVTWANGQYMRRCFGVNAEQAAASGLPRYNPSAGFKEINAGLAIN